MSAGIVERLRKREKECRDGGCDELADEYGAAAARIEAQDAEIKALGAALHRIGLPGIVRTYSAQGHEEAVLLARAALARAAQETQG